MLSFLAPYALWGLALLAIPIAAHIFRPRKVRPTPFSSLRWLHRTQQRLSRRIKWHQVFLFLLRAAFVLLVVLALARPLFRPADANRATERFIVLDVSRSMSYRAGDRPTPLEEGKRLASELVKQLPPDDRSALFLSGSSTRVLWPLTRDAGARLPALDAVQVSGTGTELGSALPLVRSMLGQCRADATVELFVITDNHQQSWNQGEVAAFVKDLPAPVRVRILDVGVTSPQNAWIADARLLPPVDDRRLLRVQVACVGDSDQVRTVRFQGLPGLPEQTREVTLSPGEPARADFEVPADFDLHGKVAHLALEPEDGLPSDDHFHLNLDTPATLKVLVIEGESATAESLRPGYHLCAALEVLAAANPMLSVVVKGTDSITAQDVGGADSVFLVDVPALSDSVLAALEERVKNGTGLAIFLGPRARPAFYNSRLYSPLHPAEGLLALPLKRVAESSDGLAPITDVRWNHLLLSGLFDPLLGDLAQVRARSFYQFDGVPSKSDTVVARFEHDVPALVERRVKAGTVLLFNTTASDEWSDLPRKKSFVPLVDRVLTHVSGGGLRRTFQVGEVVTLALPGLQPGEKVTVTSPAGRRLTPTLTQLAGRTFLRLDPVSEAGVYRVERPAGGEAFVVQVEMGDSVLTPMDSATLAKWWEPAYFQVVNEEALRRDILAPAQQTPLWPWLVTIAAFALLAEMYFVHRLCPRVTPPVPASVVHQRRILTSAKKDN
jgi:hypothetical protein